MKHTRLLEIIREEISSALNEIEKGEIELPKGTPPATFKQYTDKGFDVKIVDPLTGKMVQKESESKELEEDTLNEEPNIDGPLDFTLKSPNEPITPDNINQGALQRSIDNAVEAIKKEYPEYNSNKLSNLIMKVNGQKPLKADSFSPEVLKALKSVKDTIQQQYDIFGVDNESKSKLSQFIKDYKSNPESPDSPFIAPSNKINLEKFLSGEKKFTDNIGYNQTETAVEKALGIKPKKAADIISTGSSTEKKPSSPKPKAEKPSSTGKKGRPAGEPKTEKTATLTKGDDGFDAVEYSDDEGSAEAMKAAGSDETAKELGKVAYSKNLTPEEETQYKTARDGINAKIKRIEDGEEKPNDRALLQRAYQNSEIQRLFKAKGSSLNDILKGIIG